MHSTIPGHTHRLQATALHPRRRTHLKVRQCVKRLPGLLWHVFRDVRIHFSRCADSALWIFEAVHTLQIKSLAGRHAGAHLPSQLQRTCILHGLLAMIDFFATHRAASALSCVGSKAWTGSNAGCLSIMHRTSPAARSPATWWIAHTGIHHARSPCAALGFCMSFIRDSCLEALIQLEHDQRNWHLLFQWP